MEQFQRLIDFVTSINGMVALCFAIVAISLAVRYELWRWMLFGATMYAASVQKYFDPWTEEWWPPFWGPIELIVTNGRPICVILLGMMIALAFYSRRSEMLPRVPPLMAPIHAIQLVIFFKMLLFGTSASLTIQAGIIFLLTGIFIAYGLRQWGFLQNRLEMVAAALTTTLLIFVSVSFFQLRIDPSAAILAGRLMGTTANPQHAAVFLAIGVLGPAYYALTWRDRSPLVAIFALALLGAAAYLIAMTGSRTGLGMTMIGILILFRRKVGVAPLVVISIGLLLFYPANDGNQILLESRVVNYEDTRSHVWRAQWGAFVANPVFGLPNVGDQFRSGENSWLGLLAGAGLAGAFALTWLLVQGARTAKELLQYSTHSVLADDIDFCLAGMFAVLAGSFFEAYLLGVITMPVLFIAMLSVACEATLFRCREIEVASEQWLNAPNGSVGLSGIQE